MRSNLRHSSFSSTDRRNLNNLVQNEPDRTHPPHPTQSPRFWSGQMSPGYGICDPRIQFEHSRRNSSHRVCPYIFWVYRSLRPSSFSAVGRIQWTSYLVPTTTRKDPKPPVCRGPLVLRCRGPLQILIFRLCNLLCKCYAMLPQTLENFQRVSCSAGCPLQVRCSAGFFDALEISKECVPFAEHFSLLLELS